jgi:hypothetical protein
LRDTNTRSDRLHDREASPHGSLPNVLGHESDWRAGRVAFAWLLLPVLLCFAIVAFAAQTTSADAQSHPAAQPAAGARRATAGKVYFTRFPGAGRVGELLTVKPSVLQMSGDASWIINRVRWSSWGGATAHGTGVSAVETCNPNCAAGGIRTTNSRVTLTKLVKVHGKSAYECYSVSSYGGSAFARRRASGLPARACLTLGL